MWHATGLQLGDVAQQGTGSAQGRIVFRADSKSVERGQREASGQFLTGKRGVDVIFDSVGEATWSTNVRAAARLGRIVVYGATTGARLETDGRLLFWKQLEIIGTTMSNRREFAAVMQLTRQARLRQGALSWGLFRDAADAARYIEYFVDENWVEHQRRMIRFSAHDAELRDLRLSFHLGSERPELKRYVADASIPPSNAFR